METRFTEKTYCEVSIYQFLDILFTSKNGFIKNPEEWDPNSFEQEGIGFEAEFSGGKEYAEIVSVLNTYYDSWDAKYTMCFSTVVEQAFNMPVREVANLFVKVLGYLTGAPFSDIIYYGTDLMLIEKHLLTEYLA